MPADRRRSITLGQPQRLTVNGADFAYEIVGEGPVLTLIHAGIADRRMWQEQGREFGQHFRVLRYDLRGMGQSSMPDEPFSHHHDLREILRALGINRTHLVGLSMGGSIALDFTLAYPDPVDHLIVSSVLGPPPRSPGLAAAWAAAEEAYERGGLDAVNEVEMQIWVDGPSRLPNEVDPEVRALVATMNIDVLRREEETTGAIMALDPPAWERLGEIVAPTLVISGDIDQPDVLDYTQRLATHIPDSRLEIVTGTAHMVNMEAPDRFNQLVVNFLAG